MNQIEMQNPYQIEPKRIRLNDPRFAGGHYYRLLVGRAMTRRQFRRATSAEEYGQRLMARWRRLYDAAIAAQISDGQ